MVKYPHMPVLGKSRSGSLNCAHFAHSQRNVAGDGRITLDQVVEAETLHIIHELRDGSHTLSSDGGTPTIPRFTYLPEFWKSQNSQLNNSEAARSAAILITRGFLRPQDTPAKSIQRGNDAVLIFNVMMQ